MKKTIIEAKNELQSIITSVNTLEMHLAAHEPVDTEEYKRALESMEDAKNVVNATYLADDYDAFLRSPDPIRALFEKGKISNVRISTKIDKTTGQVVRSISTNDARHNVLAFAAWAKENHEVVLLSDDILADMGKVAALAKAYWLDKVQTDVPTASVKKVKDALEKVIQGLSNEYHATSNNTNFLLAAVSGASKTLCTLRKIDGALCWKYMTDVMHAAIHGVKFTMEEGKKKA